MKEKENKIRVVISTHGVMSAKDKFELYINGKRIPEGALNFFRLECDLANKNDTWYWGYGFDKKNDTKSKLFFLRFLLKYDIKWKLTRWIRRIKKHETMLKLSKLIRRVKEWLMK